MGRKFFSIIYLKMTTAFDIALKDLTAAALDGRNTLVDGGAQAGKSTLMRALLQSLRSHIKDQKTVMGVSTSAIKAMVCNGTFSKGSWNKSS